MTQSVLSQAVLNVFCKTGPGGGIDPSCKSKSGDGRSALTLAETDAVNVWTLNAWGKVKRSQREGTELGKNFNSAIAKMPVHEGESYRGITIKKDDDRYDEGKSVKFATSESFSSDKDFAEGWAAEHPSVVGSTAEGDRIPIMLIMPKSKSMRDLVTIQNEVVNQPGLETKVVKTEWVNGVRYTYLEVVKEPTNNTILPGAVLNVFCPTGAGGGIDPTCKVGSAPKDSKASHAVYYHGSGAQFDKFDLAKLHSGADKTGKSFYGHGVYLSGEPWKGAMYAMAAEKGGTVYRVEAKLDKPLVVKGTGASELGNALKDAGFDPALSGADLTKKLKDAGYDGIKVLKDDGKSVNELVVFDPSSLKIVDKTPVEEFDAKKHPVVANALYVVIPTRPTFSQKEAVLNVFCPTGRGGGIDPGCKVGGAPGPNARPGSERKPAETSPKPTALATRTGTEEDVKRPKVGETVTVAGSRYIVEPLDGDDSFPPAVAHYEIKDGYLMYTGRNGSEGVVSGSKKDVEKWMEQVRKELQSRPTSETTARPWTPADGGAANIEKAKDMVAATAQTFGIPTPDVKSAVAVRALESGSHAPGHVELQNPHHSTPNTSLNFKTNHSYEVHIAAHETAHAAFSHNPEVGRKYQEKLRNSGEAVSVYHAFAGPFEGLMDLGAAYVHSPQQLKQYSPKLYEIAEQWAAESRGAPVSNILFPVLNVFCPTGKGGGINPTCSPKGGGPRSTSAPSAPSAPTSTAPRVAGVRERLALDAARAKLATAKKDSRVADTAARKGARVANQAADKYARATAKEMMLVRDIKVLKGDLKAAKAVARRKDATAADKKKVEQLSKKLDATQARLLKAKQESALAKSVLSLAGREAKKLRNIADKKLAAKNKAEDRVNGLKPAAKAEPKPAPPETGPLKPPEPPNLAPYVPPPAKPVPPGLKPYPEMDPNRPPLVIGGGKREIPQQTAEALHQQMQLHGVMTERRLLDTVGGEKQLKELVDKGYVRESAQAKGRYFVTVAGEKAVNDSRKLTEEITPPKTVREAEALADRMHRYGIDPAEQKQIQKYLGLTDQEAFTPISTSTALEKKMREHANPPAEMSARLAQSPHEARRQEMLNGEAAKKVEQYRKDYEQLQQQAFQSTRARNDAVADRAAARTGTKEEQEAALKKYREAVEKDDKIQLALSSSKHPSEVEREHFLAHFKVPNPNDHSIAAHEPHHQKTADEATAFINSIQPADGAAKTPVRTYYDPLGDTRAHYQINGYKINIHPKGEDAGTMVHEMGHHLDSANPKVISASQAFLKHRVKDEDAKPMTDFHGGYRADERGRDDDFAKAFGGSKERGRYAGKDYGDKHTEIVSMGLEQLHRDPVKFARDDPEYFNFVMGVLHGDAHGNPVPER